MDAVWATLACPLCGQTLVCNRSQFPDMAHSDVVAMNFLQKAMDVHWQRFCAAGGDGLALTPEAKAAVTLRSRTTPN